MSENSQDLERWQNRWDEGVTRWEIGAPHPLFDEIWHTVNRLAPLPKGARILVPGCGRAQNAAHMARMGYQVTAIDIVEKAVRAAEETHGSIHGLTIKQGNALESPEPASYDAVFDRAMLCALEPHLRSSYIDACFRSLKPGGLFFGILFFAVNKENGPPFAISNATLQELFAEGFDWLFVEQRQDGHTDEVILEETLCILQKSEPK